MWRVLPHPGWRCTWRVVIDADDLGRDSAHERAWGHVVNDQGIGADTRAVADCDSAGDSCVR